MAFVEYLHAQPLAHFTRPQLAIALRQQTGVTYADHYLPVILRQMGLRYDKPRPVSARRPPQAELALIERLKDITRKVCRL